MTVFITAMAIDATSVTVGAGILSAGQNYTYESVFDDSYS